MNPDLEVKLAVYHHFAETGRRPAVEEIRDQTGLTADEIRAAYTCLRAQRVLLLEADGVSIRMAPPFSGVSTQHVVMAGGRSYFANCAWDALGIPAALQSLATVHSRCEQSMEPLHLEVGLNGPEKSDWVFHCVVPAAHWWDDLVFT
jgi:hypothetical protein